MLFTEDAYSDLERLEVERLRFVDTPNLAVIPTGTLMSIVAADFDGDLDIDLAVGMSNSPNQLMVNRGGTWTLPRILRVLECISQEEAAC